MGRYYSGDIKGKFWCGFQESYDADFFGVKGTVPDYIEYCFEKENLPDIKNGVNTCIKELKPYKDEITRFFSKGGEGYEGYNKEMLAKSLKVDKRKAESLLKWYARLELGQKILKQVKKEGSCYFEAEL
jgi:hypothetical protein